jgi:hypothetical protein
VFLATMPKNVTVLILTNVHMPSLVYTKESGTTPFQEGQDDVDIPRVMQDHALSTQAQVIQWPITRNHAKKLQHEVQAFLDGINFKIYENIILPKCSTLVVLRYIHKEDDTTKHGEEVNNKKQSDQWSPVPIKDPGGFRSDDIQTSLETKSHQVEIRI